jgi:glutaredoxin
MFCGMVKEFLYREGIDFSERDISQDEEALTELLDLGIMTTPVTVVGGEVVVGFDRKKLQVLQASLPR